MFSSTQPVNSRSWRILVSRDHWALPAPTYSSRDLLAHRRTWLRNKRRAEQELVRGRMCTYLPAHCGSLLPAEKLQRNIRITWILKPTSLWRSYGRVSRKSLRNDRATSNDSVPCWLKRRCERVAADLAGHHHPFLIATRTYYLISLEGAA